MRKALEIEKNIEEINNLLNSVVELTERKQSELYRLKEKHREHLEKHVGGAQAASQRREMRSFEDELEDLKITKESLEKKIVAEREAAEQAGIYLKVLQYHDVNKEFYIVFLKDANTKSNETLKEDENGVSIYIKDF